MKKISELKIAIYVLIFCTSFIYQPLQGQNLVPNPSFEDTVFCPLYLSQIYAAKHWMNYGISPDYFNTCNTTGVSVPNSVFGFQYAHSGTGMAGIFLKRKSNAPEGPNAREYIATELVNNLNIGSTYFFSCYINFSYMPNVAMACNKFGMKLTTMPYDSSQYLSLINNFSQIYSDSIVSDTVQWFKLKGSFVADSSYLYLILGNFFDDQLTDTLSFEPNPDYAYYYIDDVCLSLDSNYCESWTSIPEQINLINPHIKVFPNPSIDHVFINSLDQLFSVELYDQFGKLIYTKSYIENKNYYLNISNYSNGIYLLKVQTQFQNIYEKIIKNNY